jgi:cell division septation protein DedD
MSRSYYVIELSARWLTVLLVALALVMVLAFALGYGAAWSVLSAERTPEAMTALKAAATPTDIPEVVIPTVVPAETPLPTATPTPPPTATQLPLKPTATPVPKPDEFFVQVLASSSLQSVQSAQSKLDGLGFPRDHQLLTTVQAADSATLYKLRVGPFPDRNSADRVAQRMSAAGFPDAWVVAP